MADYTLLSTSHGNRISRRGLPFVHDSRPMAAAAVGINGCLAAVNSAGLAFGTTLTVAGGAVAIAGVFRLDVDNSTGIASAKTGEIEAGDLWLDNDTTNPITQAMIGVGYCYVVDNHTVGSSDVGGTLVLAGVPTEIGSSANGNSGKVSVRIAGVTPYAAASSAAQAAFKARVVMTSLAASYVGSGTGTLTAAATGALATQDGVTTFALGDVLFIQEGTTNLIDPKDAGPWQITTLGATGVKNVFQRPSWYAHGSPIVPGTVIEIGGEGTGTDPGLAGTSWKSFAAKGKIIGTDAPVFWPRRVNAAVTLASGTLASARTTIPVRSATGTAFVISSNPATAPHANTRVWRVSALTAGVTGSSSVQIVAETAPGTTNASDVGQYNLSANNW